MNNTVKKIAIFTSLFLWLSWIYTSQANADVACIAVSDVTCSNYEHGIGFTDYYPITPSIRSALTDQVAYDIGISGWAYGYTWYWIPSDTHIKYAYSTRSTSTSASYTYYSSYADYSTVKNNSELYNHIFFLKSRSFTSNHFEKKQSRGTTYRVAITANIICCRNVN